MPDEDVVALVHRALRVLEEAEATLAPYAPTPPELVDRLAAVAAALAARLAGPRQPLLLEAGCGDGRVAEALAAASQGYTVCLELDAELCARARRRAGLLVDVVQADLRRPPLARGLHLAYAYLLPDGVAEVIRHGLARIVLSLDYAAPGYAPRAHAVLDRHYLYVYALGVDVDRVADLLEKLPELLDAADQPDEPATA